METPRLCQGYMVPQANSQNDDGHAAIARLTRAMAPNNMTSTDGHCRRISSNLLKRTSAMP